MPGATVVDRGDWGFGLDQSMRGIRSGLGNQGLLQCPIVDCIRKFDNLFLAICDNRYADCCTRCLQEVVSFADQARNAKMTEPFKQGDLKGWVRAVSTPELVYLPLERLNVIVGKARFVGFAMNDKYPRAEHPASAHSREMNCAPSPSHYFSQQDAQV